MVRLIRRSTSVSVSVIIPVKDDADNLRVCLTALAAQRIVVADEIIVVDNGSADDSVEVAESLGARVIHESNPGIAAAASAGYDAAESDIIARVDADSIPAKDWIEAIHRAFDADPMLVAITGGASFSDGPRMLRRVGAALYLGSYFTLIGAFLGHAPLFGSNCAFRRADWREIREEVHRDDILMHDDVDLSLHLGPIRRMSYEPSLKVKVSSRPLAATPAEAALRWRRAFHTLFGHGPTDLPWARVMRRWGAGGEIVRATEVTAAGAVDVRHLDDPRDT